MPSPWFRLCPIAYEGLDVSTRTVAESLCGEEFRSKDANKPWYFPKNLSDKYMGLWI